MRAREIILREHATLPARGQTPFWVAPLAPLTAELKRTWGRSWSWTSGGCFAFAGALHAAYGGQLCGACSNEEDDFPVEHAMVSIGGQFYDFTGVVDVPAYMQALSRKTGRELFLKKQNEDGVFWFEDEYLDDDDMALLQKVLAGRG